MDQSGFYVDTVTVYRRTGVTAGTKGDGAYGAGVELRCRVETDRSRFPEGIGAVSADAFVVFTDKGFCAETGITDIKVDDVVCVPGQDLEAGGVVVKVSKQRTRDGEFESWDVVVD